jgi:hypothetical protein
MKIKAGMILAIILIAGCGSAFASDPKLDGAYKFVGLKFPGGAQTEADAKGMIVVHGKYMAFVRASVGRKTWDQTEPQEERAKKIIAAYQGLAATAGTFEIQGNTIILQQVAQANPGTMGATAKWEFKLDGKKLIIKPVGGADVEFTFERLP